MLQPIISSVSSVTSEAMVAIAIALPLPKQIPHRFPACGSDRASRSESHTNSTTLAARVATEFWQCGGAMGRGQKKGGGGARHLALRRVSMRIVVELRAALQPQPQARLGGPHGAGLVLRRTPPARTTVSHWGCSSSHDPQHASVVRKPRTETRPCWLCSWFGF